MKQATMICAGAVLLAVAGVMHKLTEPARPQYAFEIPAMVLQCIDFPVPNQNDWTVPSFKFEQAVRFNFLDFKIESSKKLLDRQSVLAAFGG